MSPRRSRVVPNVHFSGLPNWRSLGLETAAGDTVPLDRAGLGELIAGRQPAQGASAPREVLARREKYAITAIALVCPFDEDTAWGAGARSENAWEFFLNEFAANDTAVGLTDSRLLLLQRAQGRHDAFARKAGDVAVDSLDGGDEMTRSRNPFAKMYSEDDDADDADEGQGLPFAGMLAEGQVEALDDNVLSYLSGNPSAAGPSIVKSVDVAEVAFAAAVKTLKKNVPFPGHRRDCAPVVPAPARHGKLRPAATTVSDLNKDEAARRAAASNDQPSRAGAFTLESATSHVHIHAQTHAPNA
jgi:hypothetical protein